MREAYKRHQAIILYLLTLCRLVHCAPPTHLSIISPEPLLMQPIFAFVTFPKIYLGTFWRIFFFAVILA